MDKIKKMYILISLLVLALLGNFFYSKKDTTEIESVNIYDFKSSELSNKYTHYNFLGAIENNLYGIGLSDSGGFKSKVIFYENDNDDNTVSFTYEDSSTINEDFRKIDTNSIHNIRDGVYSFVVYGGSTGSINEIVSYNFNNKKEKLLKRVEASNEFVIYDAYVCNDDIYEFAHLKDGIDTISSEKKGLLQSYKSVENKVSVFNSGDKLYYAISSEKDNSCKLYEDDVLINEFPNNKDLKLINHYKNNFVFEKNNNLVIFNDIDVTLKDIPNVTCSFVYDNKLYYIQNVISTFEDNDEVYYIADNNIMFYDCDNNKTENVVSLDSSYYENVANLGDSYYEIVGINNDMVILKYKDEEKAIQGVAVYSLGDKLYKSNVLQGEVNIFYNDDYIIVVHKDVLNRPTTKYEIKI